MTKHIAQWAVFIVIVIIVVGTAGYYGPLLAPDTIEQNANVNATSTTSTSTENMTNKQIELILEDLVQGTGAETKSGDTIVVNYVGTLTDGKKFDSSYDRGIPFEFKLGQGAVIRGWDEGLKGMKIGGKRKLTIPPELGYGAEGQGPIPANATLLFEVELLEIK